MRKCTNCLYKWKARDILSLGFSAKGKDCPQCGQRQYLSKETQRLFTLGWLSLLCIPFIFYRIKLSNKDEQLFD